MPLAFSGPATPLDDGAIANAAQQLGCEVAAVRAVIDVESQGGFLPEGRPKIGAAVIAFQAGKGLAADGIVGRETWAALGG